MKGQKKYILRRDTTLITSSLMTVTSPCESMTQPRLSRPRTAQPVRRFTPITTDKNPYNSENKYYLSLHGGLVSYKKTYELLLSTFAFCMPLFFSMVITLYLLRVLVGYSESSRHAPGFNCSLRQIILLENACWTNFDFKTIGQSHPVKFKV